MKTKTSATKLSRSLTALIPLTMQEQEAVAAAGGVPGGVIFKTPKAE